MCVCICELEFEGLCSVFPSTGRQFLSPSLWAYLEVMWRPQGQQGANNQALSILKVHKVIFLANGSFYDTCFTNKDYCKIKYLAYFIGQMCKHVNTSWLVALKAPAGFSNDTSFFQALELSIWGKINKCYFSNCSWWIVLWSNNPSFTICTTFTIWNTYRWIFLNKVNILGTV